MNATHMKDAESTQTDWPENPAGRSGLSLNAVGGHTLRVLHHDTIKNTLKDNNITGKTQ